MNRLSTIGRIFYASYGVLFGIQNFIFWTFIATLVPMPKWLQPNAAMTWIVGGVVLVLCLAIAVNFKGQFAATLVAVFYFLVVLVLHLQKLVIDVSNGGEWTVVAELIALSAGGIITATLLPLDINELYGHPVRKEKIQRVASYVFALTLGVFAVLHFRYADFISFLIPHWIPFRVFVAYVVGIALALAALAIFTRFAYRLATTLLGIMFIIMVVIEHIPRVISNPASRDEWSSAVIALAMSGVSFMLASTTRREL